MSSRHKHTHLACCGFQISKGSACVLLVCMLLLARPIFRALPTPAITGTGSHVLNRSMSKKGSYTYEWPKPSVTVDAVIVAKPSAAEQHAQVLLIKRKQDPFEGYWALPGGFVDENEPLDQAAARELKEETSVDAKDILMTQVGAFGDPGRDPRGWCVGVAYAALVPSTDLAVKAADDAAEANWHDILDVPILAFDHKLILRTAFRHLAREDAVQGVEGLPSQLRKAADQLEGPWQHTEQQKKGRL